MNPSANPALPLSAADPGISPVYDKTARRLVLADGSGTELPVIAGDAASDGGAS